MLLSPFLTNMAIPEITSTDAIHRLGLHVDRHLVGDASEMTLLPCDIHDGRKGWMLQ
jgi:hypothetical protein